MSIKARVVDKCQAVYLKGRVLNPPVFRLDVLIAIALSLAVFMQSQMLLSFLWGFGLHRLTVRRWDLHTRSYGQGPGVPVVKKALCMFGILVASGLANVLCAAGALLSAEQARSAAILALVCAGVVLFGGAAVVSRFVNRTWVTS